jgi:hypothetical protein
MRVQQVTASISVALRLFEGQHRLLEMLQDFDSSFVLIIECEDAPLLMSEPVLAA